MWMTWLLAAGVLAQGADAASLRFEAELNPLIVALGPTAYLAKIALILLVASLVWSLPRLSTTRPRLRSRMAASLSWLLLGTGLVGTFSNLR